MPEVGALEPLVEPGGAQRSAHLVGHRDEQADVVLVERARGDLLQVDRAPQRAVDPQRHDELRAHVERLRRQVVVVVEERVGDQHRGLLAQAAADHAVLHRLRPAAQAERLEGAAAHGGGMHAAVLADPDHRAEEVAERQVELVHRGLDHLLRVGHARQPGAQRVGQRELARPLLEPGLQPLGRRPARRDRRGLRRGRGRGARGGGGAGVGQAPAVAPGGLRGVHRRSRPGRARCSRSGSRDGRAARRRC